MKNVYHIIKIIENLCEKENNGPKGVIVEKNRFENKRHYTEKKLRHLQRIGTFWEKSHRSHRESAQDQFF